MQAVPKGGSQITVIKIKSSEQKIMGHLIIKGEHFVTKADL